MPAKIERKFEVLDARDDPDKASQDGCPFEERVDRLAFELGISLKPFGASAHVESTRGRWICIVYTPEASDAIDIENINALVAAGLASLQLGAKKPWSA